MLFHVLIRRALISHQETLETKKGCRDYGLVIGEKVSRFARRQIGSIKAWWLRQPGEEAEPLLKDQTRGASDDEAQVPSKALVTAKSAPGWREVISYQSTLCLSAYSVLALHSLGCDQLLPIFLYHPAQDSHSPPIHLPFSFACGFGSGIIRGFLTFRTTTDCCSQTLGILA